MTEWWTQMDVVEQIFWGIALISSVFFFIVFVLSLIGMDADSHGSLDVSGNADFHMDADVSAFSVRSIVAFFTFFGWAGVIVLSNGGSILMTLIVAVVSGLAAFFIVVYIMMAITRLSESGTSNIEDALLQEGEVYLFIPPGKSGAGKVTLNLGGSMQELSAMTDGEAIATGSAIRVVDILPENVLLVEKIKKLQAA